jgi:hypothetical protein
MVKFYLMAISMLDVHYLRLKNTKQLTGAWHHLTVHVMVAFTSKYIIIPVTEKYTVKYN